jgi:hypothetical protein
MIYLIMIMFLDSSKTFKYLKVTVDLTKLYDNNLLKLFL